MRYSAKVTVMLSPTTVDQLRVLADDRGQSFGEVCRYGLTAWANMEQRKQEKRRVKEAGLASEREAYLARLDAEVANIVERW